MFNPYGKLAPTDIIKINDRMALLKERLFLKDKVIQDKIQLVEALNFFHQKQIDIFNQKLNQKNFKIEILTAKYNKLFEINKDQNKKLDKFAGFYDAVKNGISLSDL